MWERVQVLVRAQAGDMERKIESGEWKGAVGVERRAKARDPRVLRVSLGSGCERALREGCWGRRSRSLAGIDARAYFERVLGVVSRARFREGGVSQRERERKRERERERKGHADGSSSGTRGLEPRRNASSGWNSDASGYPPIRFR